MTFVSIEFLIFFLVVTGVFFLLPYSVRWIFLLAASYYFYMCWRPIYAFLILFSSSFDFVAGILMSRTESKALRKIYLVGSLLVNVGILFAFKYFNFFNHAAGQIAGFFHIQYLRPTIEILLPIGLSFHTFQSMGYAIDVYRGNIKPEKHFGIFALFVVFFPQLVAGPIERARNLLTQFHEKQDFDYDRVTDGLRLMLWGFFKKVVIADRLAAYVNVVYNNPGDYSGLTFVVATYFFAFQIFCDFSGYSDIAIGAARVLGFRLMDNFNRPYFARSILDFWRRWHISLSTWFKDYVYIPLGGNRVVKWRMYYNLVIVFLISGLWHGANWHFVCWGLFHGALVVAYLMSSDLRHKLMGKLGVAMSNKGYELVSVATTFVAVCSGWVLFRANSMADVGLIIRRTFLIPWKVDQIFVPSVKFEVVLSFGLIMLLEAVHFLQTRLTIRDVFVSFPVWVRWSVYLTSLFFIFSFGTFNDAQFIYFQF